VNYEERWERREPITRIKADSLAVELLKFEIIRVVDENKFANLHFGSASTRRKKESNLHGVKTV